MLPKELEKKLKEKMKEYENIEEFVCEGCGKVLIGMIAVKEHLILRKHYSYKHSHTGGRLGFA